MAQVKATSRIVDSNIRATGIPVIPGVAFSSVSLYFDLNPGGAYVFFAGRGRVEAELYREIRRFDDRP